MTAADGTTPSGEPRAKGSKRLAIPGGQGPIRPVSPGVKARFAGFTGKIPAKGKYSR